MILSDLQTLAPILVVVGTALVVLLLTVAGGRNHPIPSSSTHLSVIALLGLGLALWLLWSGAPGVTRAFSGAVVRDGLGVVFGTTCMVSAVLVLVLATPYLREHALSAGELVALVLLSTAGMLLLSMAGDLMTFFIGIETMSIAAYVLAGYRRASRLSQEAALKYFVYGAFASAFALFGIALLYGEVGLATGRPGVRFDELAHAFASGEISVLGAIAVALVLAGLAFKVAAVPFHMWAPDVYEGAPTPVTGFMAAGIKAAAFAGLCRFVASTMIVGGKANETSIQVFELLAMITMLVGNLLAIRQGQIKRMLAYSSIAHAGYLLVGVAAFVARPEGAALEAIGYYLFGYAGMTLGAFGVVLAFERRDDRRRDLSIERLAGVAHRYPALGLAMALFMFSLAGVPPTVGFFGKLSLFSAAIASGRVGVVVVAIIASAIGAYYYLRVLVVMYMRATTSDEQHIHSGWLTTGLWACAALSLVVGVVPEKLLSLARAWLRHGLG